MRRRDSFVVVAIVAITGWACLDATREPAPVEAPARPLPRDPSARSVPIAVAVDRPDRHEDGSRFVLTTTRGRTLDLDDLSVADFLLKVAPAARRGDAVAAYRVYQAEAMCASLDWKQRIDLSAMGVEAEASWVADLAAMTETCAGITPAQRGERFTFLDQAIRAGNPQAMLDYRVEGPNGHLDLEEVDPRDPLVVTWKQNVAVYLRQLAADGNEDAWLLLAQDCESGLVVERDLASAITYWTALQISRRPNVDPLSINFIDALARQSPSESRQAIEAGRALGLRFPYRRPST